MNKYLSNIKQTYEMRVNKISGYVRSLDIKSNGLNIEFATMQLYDEFGNTQIHDLAF
jgi:hypothetical protein